ncbi:MAG: MBL fold metallo-hydrolase [Clostridiales bacterium]|nr:MBL fold metallo-hydrolase [Clostridiales bacterium]
MARFCPLFSSSSGNSIYIGSAKSSVLIDVGVSAKQMTIALDNFGIDIETIKGIFVTHEHSDHIKGIKVFASKYNIPVYASKGTIEAMDKLGILNGKFEVNVIEDTVELDSMKIKRFNTSHDCLESTGYTVELPDGNKAAVCTDLGIVTEEVKKAIGGCNLVLAESNHDIRMLQNGMYPYSLKRRILSDKGHLSNESCSEFLKELISKGTTRFFLGHLSKENNFPELAFQTSLSALEGLGAKLNRDFILSVAEPKCTKGITVF